MLKKWLRPVAVAAAVALVSAASLLSSCASGGGQPGDGDCAELIPNVEACRTYSLQEAPDTAPKLGGTSQPVTLKTEGKSLILETGCNSVNITGHANGNTFVPEDIAAGLKICGQEMDSERWLTGFFSETTTWKLEKDSIVIANGDSKLTFVG